jgi:excisionase family DNA binding protein
MKAAKGCAPSPQQEITARDAHMEEGNTILQQYPPAMTVKQTAEILAVSPARVRELLRRGEIPGIHLGNIWRVPRHALERLLLGYEQ